MQDWLVPLAGIVISSFVTYKVATRNKSGTIQTSEAADLWAESNKLRKEYRERAEQLEKRLEEVNTELQSLRTELTQMQKNSRNMTRQIERLKKRISVLTAENRRLLALKGNTA